MKLSLGTVQFGLDYGLTNPHGKVPVLEVARILKTARARGIDLLDTAQAYGESESVLGECADPAWFKVVTKLPSMGSGDSTRLREMLEGSFRRMKRPAIYAVLFHRAEDLLSEYGGALFSTLDRFRQEGKIQKIGISAYSPETVEAVAARHPIGLLQAPMNLLDQRLLRSGILTPLKSQGVEIHVRSAYLQGALLAPPGSLPGNFRGAQAQLRLIESEARKAGVTKAVLALGFLRGIPEVDRLVIGVTSAAELEEAITAYETPLPESFDFGRFQYDGLEAIDPTRWMAP